VTIDIEQQIRALVRQELARILGIEQDKLDDLDADDELRERARAHAGRMSRKAAPR
jgi:hypothetical protein